MARREKKTEEKITQRHGVRRGTQSREEGSDGLREYFVREERRDCVHHLQPAEGAECAEPQDSGRVAACAARRARGPGRARTDPYGRGRKSVRRRRGYQRAGAANTGQRQGILALRPGRFPFAGNDGQALDLCDQWICARWRLRAGAFLHHPNRQQEGETWAAGSETRDPARLWWIATAGASLRQGRGARTLSYGRNDHGGRSAAHRPGQSYPRACRADSCRGSDGEEDYRQRASGREIHHGSDRTRRGNGAGGRVVPGGDAFRSGLRDGRHARRHEGIFGEEAAAIQGEVEEVNEVEEVKDKSRDRRD